MTRDGCFNLITVVTLVSDTINVAYVRHACVALCNIELNVLDVQFAQQSLHPIDTDGNTCIKALSFLIMPGIAEVGSLDELK